MCIRDRSIVDLLGTNSIDFVLPVSSFDTHDDFQPGDAGAVCMELRGHQVSVLCIAKVCHHNGPYRIREVAWSTPSFESGDADFKKLFHECVTATVGPDRKK